MNETDGQAYLSVEHAVEQEYEDTLEDKTNILNMM